MKVNSYIMSTTGTDNPEFADLYVFHGKSAYQAAVEQGFEGTEEEWIASLCELRFGTVGTFSDKLDTLLYVDTENDQIFRYDSKNSVYKAIGAPLGETEKTAYRGDRGKIAYDHAISDHDFLHRNGGIMLGTIQSMGIVPKTTNVYTLGSASSVYLAAHIKELNGHTIKLTDGEISTELLHTGDINTYLGSSEYRRGRYVYTSEKTLLTAFDVYGSANNTWDYWSIRDGSSDRFRFTKDGLFYVYYTSQRYIKVGNDVSFIDTIGTDSSASARGLIWTSIKDGSSLRLGTIGRFSNFGDESASYFYMGTDYSNAWIRVHESVMTTRHILPQSHYTYNIGNDTMRFANIYATTFIGALSGNASTATALQTGRTLTVGLTGKKFDGTKDLNWTLAEIGALPLTGGTVRGTTKFITNSSADVVGDMALIIARLNQSSEQTKIYQYDHGLVLDVLNDENSASVQINFTATDTENSDGSNAVSGKIEMGINSSGGTYFTATNFNGIASSAVKLNTPRTINGTSFDGSGNIITQTWGTSRNIAISDADGTNKGTAVSVNGSEDEILPLPSTIKATLSGNASSATILETARTIAISGKATGTATSFNGSKNISIPITAIDPTGVTQSASYRFVTDTQISEWNAKPTKAEMDAAFAALVDSSPELLNTLDELAAALGDDPNFATTMTNALATKLPLAGGTMTGDIKSLNIIPVTSNSYTLGNSSYVFKGVYATTFYGALSGNATSATKLATARNINIADYSGTNAGTSVSFNGTAAITLNLPDTIKATSFVGALSGNATSASSAAKLTTAVNINGTAFDGSKAITTANWGTARDIAISDSSGTNTGTAVSVNGSGAVTLLLPATIKAALSGNASSATKLATARNFNISDYSGTNVGATVSFNGSAAVTLKLPDTIKATSFVGALTGNASTATKLATARTITLSGSVTGSASFDGSGNITISTSTNHTHSYLPLSGGTLTGTLTGTSATFSGTLGVTGRITGSKISLTSSGDAWIGGMTTTNASICITTQNSENSYHPIIAGTTYSGNFWNLGTIKDVIGFYGFLKGRTENAHDWKATWDVTTGNMTNTGSITAASFSGVGTSLTSLNASNISSGTLAAARLATSGATAGSYGPSANASPAHGGTFTVPYVTVDKYGRVTSISTKTITLPASGNTDTKVTQSESTTANFRPLIMGATYAADATTIYGSVTDQVYMGKGLYACPSTASIYATTFVGALSGNAATATKLATTRKLTIGSTGKNFDGSAAVSWTLAEIGAAAASHTHNYAGSSSAGGAATTALACTGNAATATKLATARTISLTGSVTGSVSFDGSGNVSITTTTNHTHSYLALSGGTLTGTLTSRAITPSADNTYALGTSSMRFSNVYATTFTGALSGNASTATKLATARNITVNLASTTAGSFDGSAAITPGVSGTLPIANGGTGATTAAAALTKLGLTATAAELNYMDGVTSNVQTQLNGKLKGSYASATTAATAGWYRIAQTSSGISNCSAIFQVMSSLSGKHTTATLVASTNYGTDASSHVGVLQCSQYSSSLGLSKARIVFHNTYNSNYAYLEVYMPNASATTIYVHMVGGHGWTLLSPNTAGSVPSGYESKEVSLTNATMVYPTFSGALSGNASTATTLATARTLTIGSTGKSFNGSANVSWTLAEIGAAAASHTHNYAGSSSAGGSATSAVKLATARTLTIGSKGKTFDGSADVSWTLAEIGAAAASHTHSYLPLTGGSISGAVTLTGTTAATATLAFSREGYNYITFPSTGNLAFGTASSGEGIVAAVSSSALYPYSNNTKTLGTSSLKWSNVYATTFTGNLSGNASSASKLTNTAAIGSATQPVYFSANGVPVACTYTLGKSVPSNAVFTDTNTHYTTRIYAGASGTAANAAATSPYIKITDDNTYRNQIRLVGSGSVTVSSDANGNITISGTDTNTTYSAMTAATASAAGKAGLVPAPAAGKQTSFLRGDGTWVVPTNTTYSNFVKSGSGAKAGLVPAPSTTAGTTKYLREDGTWAVPPDTNTTYTLSSITGTLAIAKGGTGATDAATARTNLGLGSAATLTADTAASNNTVARRTSSGYLYATYLNQSSSAETPTTSSYIMYANSDGFLRKSSLANIKSILGLGSAAYTASTAYAAASHTHSYLPLSGGIVSGHTKFHGGIYNATASTRYGTSAIEIRENGLVGTTQSSDAYAPSIGFHWSGLTAAQLSLTSDGAFTFFSQSGAYSSIKTGLIHSDKGLFDDVIYFKTFNELCKQIGDKLAIKPVYGRTFYPIYIGTQSGTTAVDLGTFVPSSGDNSRYIASYGVILDFRYCHKLYSTKSTVTPLINGSNISIRNLQIFHSYTAASSNTSNSFISITKTASADTNTYYQSELLLENCDITCTFVSTVSATRYFKTVEIVGPASIRNNRIICNTSSAVTGNYYFALEISNDYGAIITGNTICSLINGTLSLSSVALNIKAGSKSSLITINGNIISMIFNGVNANATVVSSGNVIRSKNGNFSSGT